MAGRIEDLGQQPAPASTRCFARNCGSPLSRLQVALALVEDSGDETIRRRYLKHMEQDLERLNELIGEMLRFTRIRDGQAIESENLDLVELVEAIVESARLEAQPRQVQGRTRCAAEPVTAWRRGTAGPSDRKRRSQRAAGIRRTTARSRSICNLMLMMLAT